MPLSPSPTAPGTVEATSSSVKAEGLRGVHVSDSSISLVDGVNGQLLYRGYDISDLAEHSSFEETCFLLLNGQLPTRTQLKEFSKQVAADRRLPPAALRFVRQVSKDGNPMDQLRTAISLLGMADRDASDASPEARARIAVRLIAQTATLVAALHRVRSGQPVIGPRRTGTHAANFLRMLMGKDPDEFQARAMDVALILHADHEFNASTFSARVTVSTLSDPYSAVTSAIGTLKGPLHGGANLAVMRQLEQIGSPERVEGWVHDQLAKHEKVMGFGHAVYRTMDPRATVLKRLSQEAARLTGERTWFDISAKLQDAVQKEKGLWPNVDFYSAGLYRVMGIPPELFPSLFAVSRISGWMAHVREQLENNKLIRPLSNYVGPGHREYVSVNKRR